MNPRLRRYLESIGLRSEATQDKAWEFFASLEGLRASIANALNHNEADSAARTSCDLMIRALGHDPENPTELLEQQTAATQTQDQPPAEPQRQQPGDDGASANGAIENARREAATRERDRIVTIRRLAAEASVPDEVCQRAISESWSEDRVRREFWRHLQENRRAEVPADVPATGNGQQRGAPAVHSRNSEFSIDSLAAALMLSNGVDDPTRRWPEFNQRTGQLLRLREVRDDETALLRAIDQGNQFRGLSIRDICVEALALDGMPNVRAIPAEIIQASRAAPSTAALVGTFSQTFGAIMLASYEEAPDSTRGWTIERDNPNFFANERHRWEKMGALTKHGRGQTAEHNTVQDVTEPVKVNRYSSKFVVDEIDLINDSFGALSDQSPIEMGAAAARLRPDLVYAILVNNPNMRDGTALFHANHGNLGNLALDKASLQAGITAISTQTESGVNLNLFARWLVVPHALRFTARELIGSPTIVIAGSTERDVPTQNALFAEDLSMVSEARLDNGVTDPDTGTVGAGSNKNWYLFTNASQHTVEVTYLRGMARAPELRSYVLTQGQWGIGFDVKQDIGAKALDWRGCYKSVAP